MEEGLVDTNGTKGNNDTSTNDAELSRLVPLNDYTSPAPTETRVNHLFSENEVPVNRSESHDASPVNTSSSDISLPIIESPSIAFTAPDTTKQCDMFQESKALVPDYGNDKNVIYPPCLLGPNGGALLTLWPPLVFSRHC